MLDKTYHLYHAMNHVSVNKLKSSTTLIGYIFYLLALMPTSKLLFMNSCNIDSAILLSSYVWPKIQWSSTNDYLHRMCLNQNVISTFW